MTSESEKWNLACRKVNTHTDQIDPNAADNIVIAWPVVFELLAKLGPKAKNATKASGLDFGCGTGGFCNALHQRAFSVTGIDFSKEMVALAQAHSPADIRYQVGGAEALPKMGQKFDAVTSIMVLQFVESLDDVAERFHGVLKPDGIALIVVVNPDFVRRCLDEGVNFKDFCSVA